MWLVLPSVEITENEMKSILRLDELQKYSESFFLRQMSADVYIMNMESTHLKIH